MPVNKSTSNKWYTFIPWFLTIAATLTLIAIGWFLVNNIIAWQNNALDQKIDLVLESTYRIHVLHMQISLVQRSIGLFSGFAILFLGMGVSFYSMQEQTDLEIQTQNITAKIITASPGIIAMLIGMTLILFTIASKDAFPPYIPKANYNPQPKVVIPQ